MFEVWLGRAGSGKTSAVCKEAIQAQENEPEGPPVYVITPDQATFLVEKRLLHHSLDGVLSRVQVYHFRRMALRLLKDHAMFQSEWLSAAGKYAVFTECYQELSDQLTVFGRGKEDFRYIDRLLKTIEQFQESGVREELDKSVQRADWSPRLRAKLQDLQKLWRHYDDKISNRFMDPYHLLPEFSRYILSHQAVVSKWSVFVDGFLGFTGQEWKVIESLAQSAGRFVLTIGIPEEWGDMSDIDIATQSEFSPFAQGLDLLQKCRSIAQKTGQTLVVKSAPGISDVVRFASNALKYLEKNMFAGSPAGFDLLSEQSQPGIRMASAPRVGAEIDGVIRDLISKMDKESLSFKDFALILSDQEVYRTSLIRALKKAGIPFSFDEKKSIAFHPLPRLILSVLGWLNHDEEAGMDLLKSDLFLLSRDEADVVENELIAEGLTFTQWLTAPMHATEQHHDKRLRLQAILNPILKITHAHNETALHFLTAFWHFIEEAKIDKTVALWEEHSQAEGDPETAQWHKQVYQVTLRIFDDVVVVLGERKLSLNELYQQFYYAFHGATTGAIPAKLDQVLVTDVSRVRAFESEVVYVLGCQEGKLPQRIEPDEMLGDEDRDMLVEAGFFIPAKSDVRQQYERYRVYMALTRAKSQLILSYAMQGEDGRAKMPAILLRKWKREFIGLELEYWDDLPQDGIKENLKFCLNPELAADKLGEAVSISSSIEKLPLFWKGLYRLFASGRWPSQVAKLNLEGMLHSIYSEKLSQQVATMLYGSTFTGNVSRLERFAACPFAHFVDYGLKARERKSMRLDARNQGEMIHRVLFRVQEQMRVDPSNWLNVSPEVLADRIDQELQGEFSHVGMNSTVQNGRNHLLRDQLKRALLRTVNVVIEHARRSEFVPYALEIGFSFTDNDMGVSLNGRIDRIDVAVHNGQYWFRIIDFKSSVHKVDLSKMYYGLSLQLLLYAAVSEDRSDTLDGHPALFAGMFYLPARDPIISKDIFTSSEDSETENRKYNRMNGLIIGEAQIAPLLDARMEHGANDLFSSLLKKNGEFRSDAPVISSVNWKRLKSLGYQKVKTYSMQVLGGDTEVAPYKLNGMAPCSMCQLQSVCAFEPSYHYKHYRRLQPLKKDDVWARLEGLEG